MKKAKLFSLATVALTSTLVLAACGGNKSNDGALLTSVGLMTVHLTNQLGKDYKLGGKKMV